ncbi:MAG: acetyl-CoA carboxylase biotin carboxyl carrier protein [Balneolaceae bacterium]|nr:MAG: acetyl-CoA carboxylase biotin carboxyl carrier protein [Balneolaceae bacterium]
MDLKLIKNILDLISESDVNEVSIEEGDFKIKVKKQSDAAAPLHYQATVPHPAASPSQPAAPEAKPEAAKSAEPKPAGEVVKSPIVGTFYEASSPDSDPFVSVGQRVESGQTLCIIEAMKIMNEIEAEFSGTVEKVLVSNASPVEFDQPLFIIKKD